MRIQKQSLLLSFAGFLILIQILGMFLPSQYLSWPLRIFGSVGQYRFFASAMTETIFSNLLDIEASICEKSTCVTQSVLYRLPTPVSTPILLFHGSRNFAPRIKYLSESLAKVLFKENPKADKISLRFIHYNMLAGEKKEDAHVIAEDDYSTKSFR